MGISDVPNAEVKPCLLRAKSKIRKIKIASVVCHRFFVSFHLFIFHPELLRLSTSSLSDYFDRKCHCVLCKHVQCSSVDTV